MEVSSFVASPLCGLTLAHLGAEVIRVDPLGGAADHTRLPTTGNGTSIYWTGLNRGKQSVACDMRSPEGQRIIQRLITAPGDGGGILATNAGGRKWLGHDVLERIRPEDCAAPAIAGTTRRIAGDQRYQWSTRTHKTVAGETE